MELWALFSLVAPGLFANPARFGEFYRTPIESAATRRLFDGFGAGSRR